MFLFFKLEVMLRLYFGLMKYTKVLILIFYKN